MLESLFLQLPMGTEWIWIAVIVGVFIFGAKKIPQLAKTFGKAKGEFEIVVPKLYFETYTTCYVSYLDNNDK